MKEEEKKSLTYAAYAIIRDLIKFSEEQGLQPATNGSLYKRLTEDYQMGLIGDLDYPDEDVESLIYKMEIEDNYVVISFPYMSMMIFPDEIELLLWHKWRHTRLGIQRYIKEPELSFIKENNLGIKIKAFAGIGGEGYCGTFATLFTPEDIQLLCKNKDS